MARKSLESLRRRVERLEEPLMAYNNLPTVIEVVAVEPGTMAKEVIETIRVDRPSLKSFRRARRTTR